MKKWSGKKKVKENIGILDAFMRIAMGYSLLSTGERKDSAWLTVLGSLKLAEGITRFCPVLYMMGRNTRKGCCCKNIAENVEKIMED